VRNIKNIFCVKNKNKNSIKFVWKHELLLCTIILVSSTKPNKKEKLKKSKQSTISLEEKGFKFKK